MADDGTPNIWDAWNFFDIQNRQLVAAYDMLRAPVESGAGRHVVLVGLLVALGSMNEGTNVACSLNPRLEKVRLRFEEHLRRWYRLRNDVAHVFERVFSPPRKGQNIPWIPGGLIVGSYNAATDIVSTGADPEASVVLHDAIEKAFELTTLLKLVNSDIREAAHAEYSRPVPAQIEAIRKELAAEMPPCP